MDDVCFVYSRGTYHLFSGGLCEAINNSQDKMNEERSMDWAIIFTIAAYIKPASSAKQDY
jgi:hypothetical protein